MLHKLTNIDRIFTKLSRDTDLDLQEDAIIEWTAEALEHIQVNKSFEEAVIFSKVTNFQCDIPYGTHAIIQIARDTRCNSELDYNIYRPEHVASFLSIDQQDPELLFCSGEDRVHFDPYFGFAFPYGAFTLSAFYKSRYSPVRLTNHSFFNSIVCQENNRNIIYAGVSNEYNIIQGRILRFNFREGIVAISLLRQVMDKENGYPMIPDDVSATEAIVRYIIRKDATKRFYKNEQGSEARLRDADDKWAWYCRQYMNKDFAIDSKDEQQNIINQRTGYLMPDQGQRQNYFGNLSSPRIAILGHNIRG